MNDFKVIRLSPYTFGVQLNGEAIIGHDEEGRLAMWVVRHPFLYKPDRKREIYPDDPRYQFVKAALRLLQ